MDINSGLAILGAAVGSTKIIEKILGPTADYLGAGIRDFAQHRVDNVKKIFEKANLLLGDKPTEGQAVPPQVLRDILNDGSYRDDDLTATYYGGILASSRTGVSRNDRGASFTALIGRLTNYQLRSHFILYCTINKLYYNTNINLQDYSSRKLCTTYITALDYITAMMPEPNENFSEIIPHVFFGLHREALIDEEFYYGEIDYIKSKYPDAVEPGILFRPSSIGVELFLWATGNSNLKINSFCEQIINLPIIGIPLCQNAKSVNKISK